MHALGFSLSRIYITNNLGRESLIMRRMRASHTKRESAGRWTEETGETEERWLHEDLPPPWTAVVYASSSLEATGYPMDWDTYMLLLSAYCRRRMQRIANALLKQMTRVHLDNELANDTIDKHFHCLETSDSLGKSNLVVTLVQILKDEDQIFPLVYEFNSSIHFFCMARMMEDALKVYRRMVEMNIQPTINTFAYLLCGYSSLGMYCKITILWGEIKRFMKGCGFPANRDLYELLRINFFRDGY
ncbi:hypothetical protein Ahy_A07g034108 [Arachis hypogaea]|uniref:Pentatricopeptide repeat-containing protein n=1 Tax=Arachis hypogaea TaxID=3818 RepID=A0A445CB22_ARAHY|nr:hypothetical protein Ahy_A07g034108 [Arachis hypogaea]